MDDLEDIVLDEIALEGLNGVSLERLWVLLEQRQVPFPLKCDESTRNFIWEDLLCHHETISFYSIPEDFEERGDNVKEKTSVKRRKGSKQGNVGTELMIDDQITKDRGYCPCYYQRRDVTGEIRQNTGTTTLQQVTEKWGNSLVLVASQEARLKALLSSVTSADMLLNTSYYCCLEMVGRSRNKGASQPSISQFFNFEIDRSYVFHMCKVMLINGLVFKENIENTAYIFLIRFKPPHQTEKRNKCSEKLLDFLENQPDKMAPRYELVEQVIKPGGAISWGRFRKTIKTLKEDNLIESVSMVAKDLPQFSCPEVKKSLEEHIQKVRKDVGESSQSGRKVEDFVIPCLRKVEQNSIVDEGEEEDDDDLKEAVPDYDFSRLNLNLRVNDTQRLYDFIDQNDREGVTANEIKQGLMMDRYRLRVLVKRLTRENLIQNFTFTPGRIRVKKYFTQHALDEGTVPEQVVQMYQERNKKSHEEQTPIKVEGPVTLQSPSEAGASMGHLSLQVSKPTLKTDGASQDNERSRVPQSFKNLQRRQQILDHIASIRVTEIHSLHKHIRKLEADMGIKTECCRKSIFRMVGNLEKEGKLNYFTREIQREKRHKPEEIKLVAEVNVATDGPVVQALLDKIIVKPLFLPPKKTKIPEVYRKLQTTSTDQQEKPKKKIVAMSDILKAKMQHSHLKRQIMEKYGYSGKMFRVEILHKFLWYILYGKQTQDVVMEPLEKLPGSNQTVKTEPEANGKLFSDNSSSDENGQAESSESATGRLIPMTHIARYLDTEDDPSDWRRYVGPGKGQHAGRAKSWATMTDVLPSIPLSLFVQIVSIGVPISDLDAMLDHPRMKHYPVEVLRSDLIQKCDINHAITSIHNCLVSLSGMGLLYFDRDQKCQSKKEVNFSLCQSGSFLDTSSSAPSSVFIEDKEYPRRVYNFTTFEDVNQFWLDFRMTCFSTRLGALKLPFVETKKDVMTLAMLAKNIHETPPDPLVIPGDHRGAGGLDSSFHAHRTINWNKMGTRVKVPSKSPVKLKFPISEAEDETSKKESIAAVQKVTVSAVEHKKKSAGGKGQKRKASKENSKSTKSKVGEKGSSGPTDSGQSENAGQEKRKAKVVSQKAEKPEKVKPTAKSKTYLVRNLHIHDEEDMVAMQRKILRRVRWSPREDNLIMLCGLALRILQVKCTKKDKRKSFVSWTVVRDILNENLEESYDKTTESAGRRYRCLLRDPININNFSVCLADIHADKKLMGDFMSRKGNYDDDALRVQEFRELCTVLSKKFESRNKNDILSLPSTLNELYQNYEVMDSHVATTMEEFQYRDVQSDEDITFNILYKIILISLLSQHFGQSDMKEIYFALRQYKQSQLQKAMAAFKSHGFMGRSRAGQGEPVNISRAIHLLPMSFQFTKHFFKVFEAPSVPAALLDETVATLDDFLTAHNRGSSQTSGGDSVALCIDEMRGNKSSILCIAALELAYDTVDIPKDIISLEMSANDRIRLQEKHELALMMEMEGGDEDGDGDESLSESPRELKRKAPGFGENVHPIKIRRHLVGAIGRKKVSFVREAHDQWRQSMAEAAEPNVTKHPKRSLIPRLLANNESPKTDVNLDASKVTEQAQSPAMPSVSDPSAVTRCSVALDHDYFPQDNVKASEELQHQSPALSAPSSEEGAAATMETSDQVDDASTASTAPSGESRTKVSDSFFTWLMMRGFVDKDYSKKPQAIHEDLIVKRCSVSLTPGPSLVQFLEKHMTASRGVLEPEKSNQLLQSPHPGDSDAEVNTDQRGKNATLPGSSSGNGRTKESFSSERFENLGQLLCLPCEPFQAFKSLLSDKHPRPSLDFTVKEHPRSLEYICNGHRHSELLSTIYQLVRRAGPLGLSYPHLLDSLGFSSKHNKAAVLGCVKALLQEQLVLEVGSTIVRLVAHKCASKWLLRTVKSVPKSTTTPAGSNASISPRKKAKVSGNDITTAGASNGDDPVEVDGPKTTDGESQDPSNDNGSVESTSERDQSGMPSADENLLSSLSETDLAGIMDADENLPNLESDIGLSRTMALDGNLPNVAPAMETAETTPFEGNLPSIAPALDPAGTTPAMETAETTPSRNLSSIASALDPAGTTPADGSLLTPAPEMDLGRITPSGENLPGTTPATDDTLPIPPTEVDLGRTTPLEENMPDVALDGASSTDGNSLTTLAPSMDLAGLMRADGALPSDAIVRRKRKKVETLHPVMEYAPVTIICHPWTNIDGSLNSKSLTMFLTSVGLLIVSKPGIKESDVFIHFQKVASPVDCLHLLRILLNAEVITRHSTYCSRKLNIFGPPSNAKPKAIVFYQPTAGALVNLALLKDNITKSPAAPNQLASGTDELSSTER